MGQDLRTARSSTTNPDVAPRRKVAGALGDGILAVGEGVIGLRPEGIAARGLAANYARRRVEARNLAG
jgi:hypothetical protein